MATLTVGQGQQFSSISAAVAASHDGDVVQVQAGTYTNDFITVNTKITLQGVGGMVNLVATSSVPNDKGIIVANNDLTVDHFEISGAQGPSGNDAGIRYQQGNLTITNSYIHDNQDGLLANASPSGTITIRNSEFASNGIGDGFTHNLYVNEIGKLTITDSYFHDANVGHEIKSRALVTEISNTRVFDNGSNSSYSIDLPNGGQATLTNNIIQQGANAGNPQIIAFGEEGSLKAANSLTMAGNTVINDLGRGYMLWDASGTPASITGTNVWGVDSSSMVNGSGASVSGTTTLSSHPALDTSHPWEAGASSAPTPTAPTPTAPTPSIPASSTSDTGRAVDGSMGGDTLSATSDMPNVIRGFDGDDLITGGTQHNEINGNKGQDTIIGHSQVGDFLLGGQGNDLIDNTGSGAHSDINGNKGADVILGGSGGDTLHGGQGDDQVTGGASADWIAGDMGHNTLTGGAGGDTFYASAKGGVSVVTDFSGAAGDRVQLDAGTVYHLSQQGADLHVVIDSGAGGDLVLQNQTQQAFNANWVVLA